MSANSPIDWVIGIRRGLSPHTFSTNLLTASKKNCKVYLILVKKISWKLLKITPADLLDTLHEANIYWY